MKTGKQTFGNINKEELIQRHAERMKLQEQQQNDLSPREIAEQMKKWSERLHEKPHLHHIKEANNDNNNNNNNNDNKNYEMSEEQLKRVQEKLLHKIDFKAAAEWEKQHHHQHQHPPLNQDSFKKMEDQRKQFLQKMEHDKAFRRERFMDEQHQEQLKMIQKQQEQLLLQKQQRLQEQLGQLGQGQGQGQEEALLLLKKKKKKEKEKLALNDNDLSKFRDLDLDAFKKHVLEHPEKYPDRVKAKIDELERQQREKEKREAQEMKKLEEEQQQQKHYDDDEYADDKADGPQYKVPPSLWYRLRQSHNANDLQVDTMQFLFAVGFFVLTNLLCIQVCLWTGTT
eukprot:CAMPEP_0116560318 /NCGR_PEP_ID=MMETSP0397-20121206/10918_1 /TAXON_ID=216820 /ORGANISM="Cyclophora tenuis, Strain ECT3854" /LENGTH=340 /DNA_ID=CAMNT_0004086251 /DNA_START=1 /DNA_END=1019 /DNA_ORIENTATION=-